MRDIRRERGSMLGALASILAIAGLTFIILASLPLSVGPGVGASNQWITIAGFSFSPAAIAINVGDTVTWQNNETSAVHTATSTSAPPGGAFDSGTISPGVVYTLQFMIAGSYSYYCSIHPSMTGTVSVNSGIPEFSSFSFVVVGLLVMMLGLVLSRRRI